MWQKGACVVKGVCGEGGGGACMAKGSMAKGACVMKGVCMAGGVCGRRDGHCSGQYASYWNAFLFYIIVWWLFRQYPVKEETIRKIMTNPPQMTFLCGLKNCLKQRSCAACFHVSVRDTEGALFFPKVFYFRNVVLCVGLF